MIIIDRFFEQQFILINLQSETKVTLLTFLFTLDWVLLSYFYSQMTPSTFYRLVSTGIISTGIIVFSPVYFHSLYILVDMYWLLVSGCGKPLISNKLKLLK